MWINGVELEYNYCEVETNRKMHEAIDAVIEDTTKTTGSPDHIADDMYIICTSTKNAFDHIFGEGTGNKVWCDRCCGLSVEGRQKRSGINRQSGSLESIRTHRLISTKTGK